MSQDQGQAQQGTALGSGKGLGTHVRVVLAPGNALRRGHVGRVYVTAPGHDAVGSTRARNEIRSVIAARLTASDRPGTWCPAAGPAHPRSRLARPGRRVGGFGSACQDGHAMPGSEQQQQLNATATDDGKARAMPSVHCSWYGRPIDARRRWRKGGGGGGGRTMAMACLFPMISRLCTGRGAA